MPDQSIQRIAGELRILMQLMAKTGRVALEQHLANMDIDISSLQLGVLHMVRHESCTSSELSRQFVIDPSTLVPTIDALVRKGYISKERDPNDRRRMPLSITDAGIEILERVVFHYDDDPMLNALKGMGPENASHLLDLMRLFIKHMPDGEEMLANVQARLKLYQDTIEKKSH